MALSRKGKLKAALVVFLLLDGIVGWQVARYYWYHGYATGTRTGYLRKITTKGPPYCKYIVGELVLQRGGEVASGGETWEFSVDTKDESSPIVSELREVEKSGKLATVRYRQDLHMWWRCAPTEFYVTGVEK